MTHDSSTPPGEPGPTPLPELNTTFLDAEGVERLLSDIETCGEIIEIIPKFGPRTQVPDGQQIGLTVARGLIASRSVRGIQFRYRFEGAEWWDTLMDLGDRYRLVRIRHDFGGTSPE